jgi:hypothetical protein
MCRKAESPRKQGGIKGVGQRTSVGCPFRTCKLGRKFAPAVACSIKVLKNIINSMARKHFERSRTCNGFYSLFPFEILIGTARSEPLKVQRLRILRGRKRPITVGLVRCCATATPNAAPRLVPQRNLGHDGSDGDRFVVRYKCAEAPESFDTTRATGARADVRYSPQS